MMQPLFKNKLAIFLAFFILAITTLSVYSPGLSGPFIFDDRENIENNSLLRISELNWEDVKSAALSGRAGPLKRPVAMLSFALNHYFVGDYQAFTFKLTNVVIQIICAGLFFVFCMQLLKQSKVRSTISINNSDVFFIAFTLSILWAVHPINLTSVLYIVQRMTSLSTLFTLITLITYIEARNSLSESVVSKRTSLYLISFICFLLAIFSKENALLIPIYLALIEWVFFAHRSPWSMFRSLPKKTRNSLLAIFIVCISTLVALSLEYVNNSYATRTFTMPERLMTEARVVCFYLSLIVLPRINAFGVFHDDIPISSSVLDPWTTLLSIVFIFGLLFIAVRSTKTKPLFAFGILFFFSGHLLESSIFGLEIAHEHRNHLASTGIIIALAGFFIHHQPFNKRLYTISICSFFVILSATTMLRALEWKDEYTLATYEASHHPESPATLAQLSTAAYKHQKYGIAEDTINKARKLDPNESAYAINSLVLAALLKKPIPAQLADEIKHKLTTNPFTASTQIAFAHISSHLNNDAFKPLQPYFVEWLEVVLDKLGDTRQASIYHYFLAKAYLLTGNTLGAINAHQQAFNLDKKFINPLFEMGNIFLSLQQASSARIVLAQIEKANANPALERRYDTHIQELKDAIQKIDNAQPSK